MKQSHSCRHSATLPSLAADHVRSGRSLAGMGFLDAEIMQKAAPRACHARVHISRMEGM